LFLGIIRILKGKQFLDLSPDRELWAEVGLGDGGDDDGQLVVEVIEAIPWPLAAAKEKPCSLMCSCCMVRSRDHSAFSFDRQS
jgi:hypothetical protein